MAANNIRTFQLKTRLSWLQLILFVIVSVFLLTIRFDPNHSFWNYIAIAVWSCIFLGLKWYEWNSPFDVLHMYEDQMEFIGKNEKRTIRFADISTIAATGCIFEKNGRATRLFSLNKVGKNVLEEKSRKWNFSYQWYSD